MPNSFPEISILLVRQEAESGEYHVEFDMSDEFVAWFKKTQGLKRWSNKRFETWVKENIEEIMRRQGL